MNPPVPIIVDKDKNLKYESAGYFYSWFSFGVSFFLRVIPKQLLRKLIKLSNPAQRVVDTATSHHAIELLYLEPKSHEAENNNRFITRFWFHLRNPKAVRNRLKLVKKILSESSRTRPHTRILSLGAGSARAVLETVKELELVGNTFHISLLDLNPEAIQASKMLAENLSIRSEIVFYNEKLSTESPVFFQKYDLIEMVGLLDYLQDAKAQDIFFAVKDSLEKNGTFITCNISNNIEKRFVSEVIDWKMKYRSGHELLNMLNIAGFVETRVIYEPLKIHAVAIGVKK